MNPTHEQTGTSAGTTATTWDIFRAWIDSGTDPVNPPDADRTDRTDGDGYVLTDPLHTALTDSGTNDSDAAGAPASVLRSAARYLERYGWIQGAYYDATATCFTPAACLVGAIGMVCYGGPVDAPAQHFDDPGYLDFEEAVLHLDPYLLVADGTEAYEFNDAKGRTLDQILTGLRQAADTPADELVDALRLLNGRDAYRVSPVGGDLA